MLRIAAIEKEDVLNGPGIRTVIYLQGCSKRCPGCHNPSTWDYNGGQLVTEEYLLQEIDSDFLADGVTFSGGEPFDQAKALISLVKKIKERNKNIWIYTGYTVEEILADSIKAELFYLADVVVDGPFIKELRYPEVPFRGSSNQRIIDVKSYIANMQKNDIIDLREV